VVVSAGSINSPQLLELSGIGQPDRLRELGSRCATRCPAWGEFAGSLRAQNPVGDRCESITFNDRARGIGLVGRPCATRFSIRACWAWWPRRSRVRSLPRGAGGAGCASGLGSDADRARSERSKTVAPVGVTCYAHPMRPESKGHIHIVSADARRPPAINFNFLSSPVDAELTVRAVRIACSVMHAPAMAPMQ